MDCGPGLGGLNQMYVPNGPTPSFNVSLTNISIYFADEQLLFFFFLTKWGCAFFIHGYCCVVDFCYRIHLQIPLFLQINIESHATYYRFTNIVLNLSNLAI